MKKTALECLKVRSVSNPFDFKKYEDNNSLSLPPIYKAFLNTYYIGSEGLIEGEKVFDNSFKRANGFGNLTYESTPNVILYNFIDISQVSFLMEYMFEKTDKILEMNLIPIAECFGQEILMVGCGEDNRDKIFLETNKPIDYEGEEPRLIFLSENIFEFLRGLVWEVNIDKFPKNLKDTSQLYRNWGEDFWRVREDIPDNSSSERSVK
ncbi:hypothetical protein P1X15_30875 [Runella sp. MFBS21]|uniref:hypothetical protein n=1 Tax=Runella sp. MFBS21 TaxID=3034018 RepID=UPI0023F9FA45|nr:hypothetical protein [Runella sp. MFBS21]MDF7822060.1 hypothetical protein [Runella sp. MFBS21]